MEDLFKKVSSINSIEEARISGKSEARLLCFHYAGGGSAYFRKWLNLVPSSIDILCVQMPGRQARVSEELPSSFDDVLVPLSQEILHYSDKPLVIYGHSMGAIMAHELAQALDHHLFFKHLVLSGRRSPNTSSKISKTISNLPKRKFLEEIRRLGGTPEEVFNDLDLLDYLYPILLSDFKLSEKYEPKTNRIKLSVPITVMGGDEDDYANKNDLVGWESETKSVFELGMYKGGHFFIDDYVETVVAKIVSIVESNFLGSEVKTA